MVISKENKCLDPEISLLVDKIKRKYPYSARSTDFWEILRLCLGFDEWLLMDLREIQNGPFDAYLMDNVRNFIEGKEINLKEIYDSTLKVGEFSQSEKRVMERVNINNILYAIFLVIAGIKPNN